MLKVPKRVKNAMKIRAMWDLSDPRRPNRETAARTLAPSGRLRVALPLTNTLLAASVNGALQGVVPDLARALARALKTELDFVPFETPELLATAATKNEFDLALVGSGEAGLAELLAFSSSFVETPASFLVRAEGPIRTATGVDVPGVSVTVPARSACEILLSQNLQQATLVKTPKPGLDAAWDFFFAK